MLGLRICPTCSFATNGEVLYCPTDGSPLVAAAPTSAKSRDPLIDQTIGGMVRVESVIGAGAVGRVYRGFQAGVERPVAIKVLMNVHRGNAEVVLRFMREAKILSRLEHPGLVRVHFCGELPDKSLYIVMDLIDGVTLERELADGKAAKWPIAQTLSFMLQLAEAVGVANQSGIVHRDLKPANVMLVAHPNGKGFTVKVLDFGIARVLGDPSAATATGRLYGTANYLSPEGSMGQKVTAAADVYSMATIFYEILANKPPFVGDMGTVLSSHISEPPPSLPPRTPLAVVEVIMRNLGKNPAQRDADGAAFAISIRHAATKIGVTL